MQFGNFGIAQILIILVVVLLIFGPRRLPELAKNMGQSVREFRKGIRDMKQDIEADAEEDKKKDKDKPHVLAAKGNETDKELEALQAERQRLRAEQEAWRAEREGVVTVPVTPAEAEAQDTQV